MPDFNHLADQVFTDMSRADWPEADLIRTEGSRRGRVQLAISTTVAITTTVAAVVAAVVVATVAAVVLSNGTWLRGSVPAVAPTVSQSNTPGPTVTPNQTPSRSISPVPSTGPTTGATTGATQQGTIPPAALLTIVDLRPTFSGLESPFAQPYTPNPFIGCGPDGLPGAQQFMDVVGSGFTGGTGSLLGGESLIRFQPGAAHQTITAISQLMAGACAGPFQVVRRNLGGDESILISSSDPNTVLPQAAHGMALYYGIERRGDYLVWITLVDQAQQTGQASLAATLTTRAAAQLCATVRC
jgi:hypothetical protein